MNPHLPEVPMLPLADVETFSPHFEVLQLFREGQNSSVLLLVPSPIQGRRSTCWGRKLWHCYAGCFEKDSG